MNAPSRADAEERAAAYCTTADEAQALLAAIVAETDETRQASQTATGMAAELDRDGIQRSSAMENHPVIATAVLLQRQVVLLGLQGVVRAKLDDLKSPAATASIEHRVTPIQSSPEVST